VNSWGKKNFAFETIERKKKVLQLRQYKGKKVFALETIERKKSISI
jgi:hypothetical protein